jgi:hypothetical protein
MLYYLRRNEEVVMELSPAERRLLLDNSVERVINTSMGLARISTHENAQMNFEDWVELKALTVKLWNDARNEAFKLNQGGKNA